MPAIAWFLALALALAAAPGGTHAADAAIEAPNVVVVSDRLVTAGQPTARTLAALSAQGFGAVISLVPPGMPDAVAGEEQIVRGQGLEFVNIPIAFNRPTQADVDAFFAAMERLGDRKLLVHCQVNMRASSMVFLHRVIVRREEPERAYEQVARVWSPSGPWKALLLAQLRRAGIVFQPY